MLSVGGAVMSLFECSEDFGEFLVNLHEDFRTKVVGQHWDYSAQ